VGALERLDAFASRHFAEFYGLPRNAGTIALERAPWTVPPVYPMGEHELVPLRAGETVEWRIVSP
jgi:dihydroorotase